MFFFKKKKIESISPLPAVEESVSGSPKIFIDDDDDWDDDDDDDDDDD